MSDVGLTTGPVGYVWAAYNLLSPGQSRAERKDKRAAERAGYDVAPVAKGVTVYTDPAGNRISRAEFYAAGRALRTSIAPTIPSPTGVLGQIPDTQPVRPPATIPQPQVPPYVPPVRDVKTKSRGSPRDQKKIKRRPVKGPVKPKIPKRPWWEPAPQPEPKWKPPKPIIDPNLPYPTQTSAVRVIARAAGRVVGVLGWLLWPSETARDDTVPGPMPSDRSGPSRRPRIRPQNPPGQKPVIVSRPAPGTSQRPKPIPRPRPVVLSQPGPGPVFNPTSVPSPTTVPPSPSPWLKPLLYSLPLAAPLFLSSPAAPSPRAQPSPGGSAPPRVPLTLFQPSPLTSAPQNSDPCKQSRQNERERKRKKRKCTNRITSTRVFRKGGAKYRTITRKLEC